MINLTSKDLLEKRHDWRFRYFEPWEAMGPDGDDISANVAIELTIHDAINRQRFVWQKRGHDHAGMDRELMLDFVAVHWAVVVDESGKEL